VLIYTGTPGGSKEKLAHITRLGLGVAISAEPSKEYKKLPCFIDNGAYEAWLRGMPWSSVRFLDLLERSWKCGISADFVVCPDIVCGGVDSLSFSLRWAEKLRPARLALAVQDGMDFNVVNEIPSYFTHIFVGGSVDWKWQNAETWVHIAHTHKMKCHIGKVGTVMRLNYAKSIGADSVDSTSWVQNDSWHILEEFLNPGQENLFGRRTESAEIMLTSKCS
jgi:hypothetical protein